MLKVSVLYPYTEGGKFDMEYFLRQHLPLVDKAWGAALIKKEIDAGLSGPGPGTQSRRRDIGVESRTRFGGAPAAERQGVSRIHNAHV